MMNFKTLICLCFLAIAKAQNGYSRDNPINQLEYDASAQDYNGEEGGSNGGEIPGEAGQDYPVYSEVPQTSFSCENQQFPGYYADPEAQCQAFYVCQKGGKSDSFLCPNGTVFNQEYLVCDWWYNFECSRAESLYSVNEQVVLAMEEADARLAQQGYSAAQSGSHDSGASYRAPSVNGNGNGNGNGNHKNNGNGNGNGNGRHSVNGNGRNGDGHFSNENGIGNGLSPKPEYGVPASAPQGISNERYSNDANGNGNGAHKNGNGQKNGFNGIANGHENNQYRNGNENGNGAYKSGNGNGQTNEIHGIANGNGNGQYQNGYGNSNGAHRNGNGNGQTNGIHGIPNGNGNSQYQNGNGNGNGAHKNGNGNGQTNGFHGIPNGNENGQYKNGNGNGANTNGHGNTIASPKNNYLAPRAGSFNSQNNGFSNGPVLRNGLGNGVSAPESDILPPSGTGYADDVISVEAGLNNGDSFIGSGPSAQGNRREPEKSYLPAL